MKLRKKLLAVTLTAVSVLCLGSMETHAKTAEAETYAVTYDSVEEYPDGGKKYTYVIDGVKNNYYVPPANFNPVTASDEELARYFFPPRPDAEDEEAYAQWVDLMSNYRGTPEPELVVTIKPADEPDNGILTRNNRSYGPRYSDTWSGYDSNLGKTSSVLYTQVQMDYVHPSVNYTGKQYSNTYWIGIGGFNTRALVQAGTSNISYTDGPYELPNFAWYQYINVENRSKGMIMINSLEVKPGDKIHVYIAFQKDNGLFGYYIANNTTGEGASGTFELSAADYYDGTTAEWVVERTQHSGVIHNLGDYGEITLTNCKATLNTSNTWLDLDSLSGLKKIIMTSDGESSGTVLSQPGDLSSSDSFTCTWKALN